VCDDNNDRSSFDSSQLNGCQVFLPEMRDKIPGTAVSENPPPDGVAYQVYHWVADRWHPFNTPGSGLGSAVSLLGMDDNLAEDGIIWQAYPGMCEYFYLVTKLQDRIISMVT
jgi:hypothetical protein